MFTHAIVRIPAPNFADGITTVQGEQPSYSRMLEQHAAYVAALRACGLEVTSLELLDAYPDGHFVEDPAIVTPEVAVVTRPGADARRGEAAEIEPALRQFKSVVRIEAPGTLDGGDVLIVGKEVFIGLSERTNQEGADQLAALLAPYGYSSFTIPVGAGLHLKSSVNYVGKNFLLLTKSLADRPEFAHFERLVVEDEEEYACNTLWVNDTLLAPAGYPKTRALLAQVGLPIVELETSEVRKMDGGLTCMSLRFS
jgi:dimethylargininase